MRDAYKELPKCCNTINIEPGTAALIVGGASLLAGKNNRRGGARAEPATLEQIQEQLSQLPSINAPSFGTGISVPGQSSFFAPLSLNTPAFNFSGAGGNFNFNRVGANPLAQFDRRSNVFFGAIDDLRSRFRPGFSELRDARLTATTGARQRGLSNLRDSLSNRRIQGSSFARAEQTQAQAEFGKLEAEQQAQSFLEEVAINDALLRTELGGLQTVVQRAVVDIQQFQAALQAVDQSRQAGTARAQLDVQGQIASLQADLGLAGLDVQAQMAELDSVVRIINSLNSVGAANVNIQSSGGGFGELAGFAINAIGRSGTGTTSTGGGGGVLKIQPQQPISNPFAVPNNSPFPRI